MSGAGPTNATAALRATAAARVATAAPGPAGASSSGSSVASSGGSGDGSGAAPVVSVEGAVRLMKQHRSKLIKFVVWCILWKAAATIEFGVVFVLLSGFWLIFTNLGNKERDGDARAPSAYAAFNRDGYQLPGTMDAQQFEAELRHKPRADGGAAAAPRLIPRAGMAGAGVGRALGTGRATAAIDDGLDGWDEDEDGDDGKRPAKDVDVKRKSKFANQPCPCGSRKKFKMCCGSPDAPAKKAAARAAAAAALQARDHDPDYQQWKKDWAS